MSDMVKKVIGVIVALFVIVIALSIIGHLIKLAINIAIIGGIGFAIYYGAKKANLIK
jgi:hypothetical protein